MREAVELPAPLPADRDRGLTTATEALKLLVLDMNALLEILPQPPPSQGGAVPAIRRRSRMTGVPANPSWIVPSPAHRTSNKLVQCPRPAARR